MKARNDNAALQGQSIQEKWGIIYNDKKKLKFIS